MEEKKDLHKISEKIYNSLDDIRCSQDAYKLLLKLYDQSKALTIDEISKVIKATMNKIEEYCCEWDTCPHCGSHLEYHSTYEDDTNSYYNRYYYCNECKFRKDID